MRKSLTSFLCALPFVFGAILPGCKILDNSLMEKYGEFLVLNYPEKGLVGTFELKMEGIPMITNLYDINQDKIVDSFTLTPQGQEKPFVYWFDFNRDTYINKGELFYDGEMDGLNGNEILIERDTKEFELPKGEQKPLVEPDKFRYDI